MRRRSRLTGFVLGVFDLLVCLVALFIWHQGKPEATPPRTQTYGIVAVTIRWPLADAVDIDLHLRAPDGKVCYWNAPSNGGMHLEHDDLGSATTRYANLNFERIIVRVPQDGEWIANVHVYTKPEGPPTPVTFQLINLQGEDRPVVTRALAMRDQGDEQTAIRFHIKGGKLAKGTNTLPRKFITTVTGTNPW